MKKILNSLSSFYKAWSGLIAAGLFVVFTSVLFVQRCNYKRDIAESHQVIDSVTLANQTYQTVNNKLGQEVTRQIAINTSNQAQLKQLTDDKFNLTKQYEKKIKDVIAYYSQNTVVKIDSVKIPYTDKEKFKRFSDSVEQACAQVINYMKDSTLAVPKTDSVHTKNFSLNYTIAKNGLGINSLEIPDSQYVRIVTIKGGFFRRVEDRNPETGVVKRKLKFHVPKTVEFQSLHTNPLVKVTGTNSIIYKPLAKPKIFWKLVEVGIGVFIGTRL